MQLVENARDTDSRLSLLVELIRGRREAFRPRVRSAMAIEPVARGERILRRRSEGVCDLAR